MLETLNNRDCKIQVRTEYVFDDFIKSKYQNLDITLSDVVLDCSRGALRRHTIFLPPNFQHFLCSFNGTGHGSRQLLVAILKKFGWYDSAVVSKNFSFDPTTLSHYIKGLSSSDSYYQKFFISNDSQTFFNEINGFNYNRFNHLPNLKELESKIASSFLHIVSETMATSYYPFFTEKFLYSVVNKGLFLAYAQPNWHLHLEKYFGFKLYKKLFDYRFDTIQHPLDRLLELMTMISKFSVLSTDDWHDLARIEQDVIDYNHYHYHSKEWLNFLKKATQ
jgi:hypothetical protein